MVVSCQEVSQEVVAPTCADATSLARSGREVQGPFRHVVYSPSAYAMRILEYYSAHAWRSC